MDEHVQQQSHRIFWVRLTLTTVVVAVPLAYGLVVEGVRPLSVFLFATAAALALLLIWDGSRLMPSGVVWWARPEPLKDMPTGLYNPAGWADLLESEEDRCRRHGTPVSVVAVEVEVRGSGDDAAARIASALQRSSRAHDAVACLGPSSFAILAINSGADDAGVLARRVRDALADAGFSAEVEVAERDGLRDLPTAWQDASGRAKFTSQR